MSLSTPSRVRLFVPLAALLCGCGGGGSDDTPIRSTPAGLVGTYRGTWTEDVTNLAPADSGTIRFRVDAKGKVTGTATSVRLGPKVAVGGTLTPGILASIYIEAGAIVPGQPFFRLIPFEGLLTTSGRDLTGMFVETSSTPPTRTSISLRKE